MKRKESKTSPVAPKRGRQSLDVVASPAPQLSFDEQKRRAKEWSETINNKKDTEQSSVKTPRAQTPVLKRPKSATKAAPPIEPVVVPSTPEALVTKRVSKSAKVVDASQTEAAAPVRAKTPTTKRKKIVEKVEAASTPASPVAQAPFVSEPSPVPTSANRPSRSNSSAAAPAPVEVSTSTGVCDSSKSSECEHCECGLQAALTLLPLGAIAWYDAKLAGTTLVIIVILTLLRKIAGMLFHNSLEEEKH